MALAGAGGTAARAAVVAPQVSASCDLQPNTYVAGTDKVGDRWGAAGYIRSYPVTVPAEDENFSDQALHVGLTEGKGLEVGWYVGFGAQTGTYVTDPHVYATADGPREVDGPYIGDVRDFYYVQYLGNGEEFYAAENSTSSFFSGEISTDGYNGPGPVTAVGEVDQSGLHMEGYFSDLEHMWSSGSFYNWTGISACADSGYSYSIGSDNSFGTS
jgi:hypothetical protein